MNIPAFWFIFFKLIYFICFKELANSSCLLFSRNAVRDSHGNLLYGHGGVLEEFPKLKVCFAHGGTFCTIVIVYL